MYDTTRQQFYWLHMASDVYEYVIICTSYVKNRGKQYVYAKHLKLFPPSGPLEFVAMDIIGPLPRTIHGNEFVLVITNR